MPCLGRCGSHGLMASGPPSLSDQLSAWWLTGGALSQSSLDAVLFSRYVQGLALRGSGPGRYAAQQPRGKTSHLCTDMIIPIIRTLTSFRPERTRRRTDCSPGWLDLGHLSLSSHITSWVRRSLALWTYHSVSIVQTPSWLWLFCPLAVLPIVTTCRLVTFSRPNKVCWSAPYILYTFSSIF